MRFGRFPTGKQKMLMIVFGVVFGVYTVWVVVMTLKVVDKTSGCEKSLVFRGVVR